MTNNPDWRGFGEAMVEHWPVRDIDGSELFEMAVKYALIVEIPGGYDPENHIDAEGICPEYGDPWYEYNFIPERMAQKTRSDAMSRDHPKDWNFDRIHSAQALIADVQNDMMRCLHSGEVNDVVRDRMCQRLEAAADGLQKLVLCHD